jgi:hypothetical protein
MMGDTKVETVCRHYFNFELAGMAEMERAAPTAEMPRTVVGMRL